MGGIAQIVISAFIRYMSRRRSILPPQLPDVEREIKTALDALLKAAVAVGKGEMGAVPRAKAARAEFQFWIDELRRSVAHDARLMSARWFESMCAEALHDAHRKNLDEIDFENTVAAAVRDLRRPSW
jgi:hypothetical protein